MHQFSSGQPQHLLQRAERCLSKLSLHERVSALEVMLDRAKYNIANAESEFRDLLVDGIRSSSND